MLSLVFFEEALNFFEEKLNIPTEHWDEMLGEHHVNAFTVAGMMNADLLSWTHEQILTGLETGDYQTFKKKFKQAIEDSGWVHTGSSEWRTKIIYKTNLDTSYSAGRYKRQMEIRKKRPYLQYRLGFAKEHRPQHEKWDKMVLPADHPWWDKHYPPNGFGCNCRVFSLSEKDLERKGLSVTTKIPGDGETYEWEDRKGKIHALPKGIDPGWDYNPGQAKNKSKDFIEYDKYPKGISDSLENYIIKKRKESGVSDA